MSKLAFGLTMMIVGIGGTFLTLTILIWSIEMLKRLFPLEPAQVQSTPQFFSLDRIPPQWREKLPLDAIRSQWDLRSAQLQRVGVEWMQKLPVDRLRTEWMQKLPIDRLQYHWNETLRLERIMSPEHRRAILSSVQARFFGRTAPTARPGSGSAGENRDETRPS